MLSEAGDARRSDAVKGLYRPDLRLSRHRRQGVVLCASMFAVVLTSAAAPLDANAVVVRTIDDFTEVDAVDPWPIIYTSVTPPAGVPNTDTFVETGLTDTKVIGTVRDSDTTLEAVPAGVWTFVAAVNLPLEEFNYGASDGVDGMFNLRYDGNSAGSAGMLDFDVATDFPSVTRIEIDIDPDIAPVVSVTVTIDSDTGGLDNMATLTRTTSGAGDQTLLFEFTDFIGPLDLSDIDAINVFVDAPLDSDFGINLIGFGRPDGTIPEPASWLLALMALASVNAVSRRRRR